MIILKLAAPHLKLALNILLWLLLHCNPGSKTNELRGILSERRKMSHGWLKCLRKTPPKLVLHNNDHYNTQKIENHHYEEPEERDNREFINMQK